MTSWEAINDRSFLQSISVTVIEAVHHEGDALDWLLTVEDASGKRFELEIWQKHDPLTNWEEGEEYEIRNAYGQVWDGGKSKKLHSSKKWSTSQKGSSYDCRLMIMGDSHVGRKEHPSSPTQHIDCSGKFERAIEIAIAQDVDAVIHTGDIFHDAVTEKECDTVNSVFNRLQAEGIDFNYILGNHECDRGNRLLRQWDRRGVATHLDMDGSKIVGGVNVYGHDYCPGSSFPMEEMGVPLLFMDSVSLLILHQTLAPFFSGADVNLDEINSKSFGDFDYVASGHLHDPERPSWDGGEFLYAGSTENLSTKPDASDPSVWVLTVTGDSIDTRREKI